MRTLILEGIVTATTQISHNGGEVNGNIAAFRRMCVIQPDLTCVDIPHVSGNSVRGKLRDVSAKHTLDLLGDEDKPHKVGIETFQLLFSGGALTSGKTEGDIDRQKDVRGSLPHISLFGGAWGNTILSGKMKINPLIPIGVETAHIIPKEVLSEIKGELPSIYTYLQTSMYTRKENSKDMEFQPYLEDDGNNGETSQMLYYIESIAAGTPFYWKVVLEDITEEEFGAFLNALSRFQNIPVVGGKSAVGFGQIDLSGLKKWTDIKKDGQILTIAETTTSNLYEEFVRDNKAKLKETLKTMYN